MWELPEGETPPPALRIRFLTSFVNMDQLEADVATLCLEQADLKANVDLRPYIDAAPFMATTLMPLPRVYRLFNQARAAARAAAPPPPPPLPHPSHAPSTCHRSARGTCPCSIVERSSSA